MFSPDIKETSPILCLQHCQKGTNITCLAVPYQCPICGHSLNDTPMELPPFRLPSPFLPALTSPCSIVIKPTKGDFLRDYTDNSDLHIGITDSRGTVYGYDQFGVTVSSHGWRQCLAVPLVDKSDTKMIFSWDIKLQECAMKPEWTAIRYGENGHNCYDFVLSVLVYMGLSEMYALDRSAFCETMVLPKTKQAAKYISLFRLLSSQGIHVSNNNT